MKRQARRSSRQLSPQEIANWRALSHSVDAEEADEIVAMGRTFRQQRRLTAARLAEALKMLRSERERQGLSLTDVQERTGIDRSALSRLETTDDPNPTFATLQRYADALGKDLMIALVDRS
jgi:transcriptional regulator with XRE-family HTH domain